MHTMTIGEVARQAGVRIDTVRYYERRGLIPPPPRRPTLHGPGYRQYTPDVVQRIRFIKRSQQLGFSLREIAELLALQVDPTRDRREVKRRIEAKIADIETKIAMLRAMQRVLQRLNRMCDGEGPVCNCPILDALEQEIDLIEDPSLPKPRA